MQPGKSLLAFHPCWMGGQVMEHNGLSKQYIGFCAERMPVAPAERPPLFAIPA